MTDKSCTTDNCCAPPPIDFARPVTIPKTALKPVTQDACASEACGCSGGVPVFDGVDVRYKRVLWTVITINGVMFLVEMIAGQLAGSQALKADALDFLGDTITYGLSLAVIGASIRTRSMAALFKGLSLSAMALWVFGSTVYQTMILGLPSAQVMGSIGLMALAANLASVLLLMRYKDGDANVRSVWLCSRNDAIGNVIVMFAALGVWGSTSAWPDLAVAAVMAGIFLTSSVQILRQAWTEYSGDAAPVGAPRRS
jgi:Co/Zn/Cd efflux system component